MGLMDKFSKMITPDEDVIDMTEEEIASISGYETKSNKAISGIASDAKMVLFEPRSFEESEEIARHLKERKAAVVNLHRLSHEYAQRCIDFLTGAIFALDGSIKKVGENVILCTPKTISVGGEIKLGVSEE